MHKLMGKESFRRILASYLLILILPVMLGLIICIEFASLLSRQISEINSFSVERVQRGTDEVISEAYQYCRTLADSSELRELICAGPENTLSADMRRSINQYSANLAPKGARSAVYIYFRSNHSLLGNGYRTQEATLSLRLEALFGLTEDQLWDLSSSPGGVYILESRGARRLVCVTPVIRGASYNYGGSVISVISDDMINSVLAADLLNGQSYIFYNDAAWKSAAGDGSYDGSDYTAFLRRVSGENVIVSARDSAYSNIRYVSSMPSSEYYRPLRISVAVIAAYALFCLAFGAIYALASSKKRYAILDRFVSLATVSAPEDAARAIEQKLRRAAGRQRELDSSIYDVSREKMLTELLIPSVGHGSSALLDYYGIRLDSKKYTVAVFSADSYETLFFGGEKELTDFELSDFAYTIIRSVAEELFRVYAQAYATRVRGVPAVLISFDCAEDLLDKTLRECSEFIEVNFGLHLDVFRGAPVQSAGELSRAYLSALEAMSPPENASQSAADCGAARRIRDYIDAHYSDTQLGIASIAECVGLSPFYVSHAFKQSMGVTVLEYINGVRLHAAKELLRTTSDSVGAIAAKVGYASVGAFTRTMRRLEGVTPSEYRKSCK